MLTRNGKTYTLVPMEDLEATCIGCHFFAGVASDCPKDPDCSKGQREQWKIWKEIASQEEITPNES